MREHRLLGAGVLGKLRSACLGASTHGGLTAGQRSSDYEELFGGRHAGENQQGCRHWHSGDDQLQEFEER